MPYSFELFAIRIELLVLTRPRRTGSNTAGYAMDALYNIGFLAIDAIIVWCMFVYVSLCSRKEPHSNTRTGDPYPMYGKHWLKRYAFYAIVFVGFYTVVYGTVHTLLFWVTEVDRENLARMVGMVGAPFIFWWFFILSQKLDELETLRLEKAKRDYEEWKWIDDAKNWVEMDDGELVEVENLHWDRFKGRNWRSCYEPPNASIQGPS
jgi:hypothetical protein